MSSNLKGLARKESAAEKASNFIAEADKDSRLPDKVKRLNVEIPVELHKRLKQAALDRECSVRDLVIQGIDQVIK